MRPSSTAGGLDGADWEINEDEIAAKKELYDVGFVDSPYDVGVFYVAVPGGFEYHYQVSVRAGTTLAVDTFAVFTLATSVKAVSIPSGWAMAFYPPETGRGKNHPAPGIIRMTAKPGSELKPGGTLEFIFFSPASPGKGAAYALNSQKKAIREFGDVLVPGGGQAVPTLTPWGVLALGLLLASSLAFMIRRLFARPAAAA
jgi:hypothetical protein